MKLFPVLLAALSLITRISAECTYNNVFGYAEAYVVSQKEGCGGCLWMGNHNPDGVDYQQNNQLVGFTDNNRSILMTPLKIDYNRTLLDFVECTSYTMWISTSGSKPIVGGVKITLSPGSSWARLYDNVVSSTGDLFFDAEKTLEYVQKQDWTVIADPTRRPSRELLRQIGDAYLDMWTNSTAADSIPWAEDCEKIEGSRMSPCTESLPRGDSEKANGMRRYVIDETVGSISILSIFDSLGPWPDSHEIRVVDGEVKYVNSFTVTRGIGAEGIP